MDIKEKTGNFLLDIAKLIFAGIIIGGIMTEEINRWCCTYWAFLHLY